MLLYIYIHITINLLSTYAIHDILLFLGMRGSCDVLIYIDLQKALNGKILFIQFHRRSFLPKSSQISNSFFVDRDYFHALF